MTWYPVPPKVLDRPNWLPTVEQEDNTVNIFVFVQMQRQKRTIHVRIWSSVAQSRRSYHVWPFSLLFIKLVSMKYHNISVKQNPIVSHVVKCWRIALIYFFIPFYVLVKVIKVIDLVHWWCRVLLRSVFNATPWGICHLMYSCYTQSSLLVLRFSFDLQCKEHLLSW